MLSTRIFGFGPIRFKRLTELKNIKEFSSSASFSSNKSPIQEEKNLPTNTGNEHIDTKLNKTKMKLFEIMSIYEEAIGLKEVKDAQNSVLEAEKNFVNAQQGRRALSLKLIEIQEKLRTLRDEMDRLNRSDSRYLQLFTEEHQVLKNEIICQKEYKLRENEERELFYTLSNNLRDSQEKERARIESVKYLQLGISVACTLLGLISAFLVNYFRNANIKEILKFNKEQFESTQEILKELIRKNVENETKISTRIETLFHSAQISVSAENCVDANEKKKVSLDEKTVADDVTKRANSEKLINSKKSVNSIPPILVNPYLLSAAVVISYICYISNR